MSVSRLKDGRWIVQIPRGRSPDGRTREYFGRDGEAAARARNAELGLGGGASLGPTFAEVLEAYYLSRQHTNEPRTVEGLYYKLKSIIIPMLGHLPASAITPARIDDYIAQRCRTVKYATAHREITIIRAAIAQAVKRSILASNPLMGIDLRTPVSTPVQPPSDAEFEAIYQAASPRLRRVILLTYFTLARPGQTEVFRIRWEDVDLEARTIYIRSARKGGLRERTIPITEDFGKVLREWRKEDGGIGHVIQYRGRPIAKIQKSWKRCLAIAGVRDFRLYDIRHMGITRLVLSGCDIATAALLAGHTSVRMTAQVYTHVNSSAKRNAVELLGKPYQHTTMDNQNKTE